MIVLDTNIVSELLRPIPAPRKTDKAMAALLAVKPPPKPST